MKIGIMASQISGHLTPATSYESIATTTLSTGATTITFSSIPATYKHLQLRTMCASDSGSAEQALKVSFNSNTTTTDYYAHRLNGNGATAGVYTTQDFLLGEVASTGSGYAVNVIDILDYTNTNKYKTGRALFGIDNNGSGFVGLFSMVWMKTDAITSITLTQNTQIFRTYSSFALYGVK